MLTRTRTIDSARIMHRNTVCYNHNRVLYKPIIAKQTRERYKQHVKYSKQYTRLLATWRHTHRDEEEHSSSRGWKEDNESKREKRSLRRVQFDLLTSCSIHGKIDSQASHEHGGMREPDAARSPARWG